MNLRDQTSILDQDKDHADTYSKHATALSQQQDKLDDTLDSIHQKTTIKQLDSSFAQTANSMKKVGELLSQPETGKPADDAEVTSIENLSDLVNLINEQAQRPNSQQSQSQSESKSDEEMQFLLQMMRNSANAKAMAAKPATGLNQNGGTTDRRGHALSGDATGNGPGSRNVQKAGGAIHDAPAEFRDALENYYHGIEQAR
jgi:hypothetical protein